MIKYKRNPDKVKSVLVENKDKQISTKIGCKIQFPSRFAERGIASIGSTVFCMGCFVLVLDTGDYSVININSMIELTPQKVSLTTIDEIEYYELYFDANTVVIKTSDVIKNDALMFNLFDEFIFKGKIPWYMDYSDLGKLFDTAESHGGSNVNKNLEVIEFIASLVTRLKEDRTKFVRNSIKDYSETTKDNISFVPLSSVFYSVNNTLNKLAGSYFNDGITSAIVNPTDKVEKIESILRA